MGGSAAGGVGWQVVCKSAALVVWGLGPGPARGPRACSRVGRAEASLQGLAPDEWPPPAAGDSAAARAQNPAYRPTLRRFASSTSLVTGRSVGVTDPHIVVRFAVVFLGVVGCRLVRGAEPGLGKHQRLPPCCGSIGARPSFARDWRGSLGFAGLTAGSRQAAAPWPPEPSLHFAPPQSLASRIAARPAQAALLATRPASHCRAPCLLFMH